MSVQVNKGAIKFKSIKAAAQAAGVPYITFYMRIKKLNRTASEAFHQKVRPYNHQVQV